MHKCSVLRLLIKDKVVHNKDRLYMKMGGNVFESSDRLEKARHKITNAKSN